MKSKKTHFPRKIDLISGKVSLLAFLTLALFLSPIAVHAAEVTLAWDPNTETNLKGYIISYGTESGAESGVYSESIDIANNSSGWSSGCGPVYNPFNPECCEYTLKDLEEGKIYLAAKAYDNDGNESAYSEELSPTIANPKVNLGTPSEPNGPSSGYIQTDYTFGAIEMWLEAEDGYLQAPMELVPDVDASSGKSIGVPNGQGSVMDPLQDAGYAEYTFDVPEAGNYVIWGRVLAVNSSDDSFFISMDGGDFAPWGTQRAGTYVWDQVNNKGDSDPVVYYLAAGVHILTIKQREDGTIIDRILITNDMNYVPQNHGEELEFRYDWGDSSISDWGASSRSHAWLSAGNFCVKTQAKDSNGTLSDWSNCKSITITENIHTIDNQPPVANAGPNQAVNERVVVRLKGNNSSDPDGSIAAYSWSQISGPPVQLSNSGQIEANFTSPNVGPSGETLIFQLVVVDNEGLQATDSCSVEVTREPVTDSDGDGVPDDQDDFPYDADEYLDTDGDGEGNNADTDDDNDGMPDSWELLYGLDPLKDDAADDPDGDGYSNIIEHDSETDPKYNESNFAPDAPQLMTPDNYEVVGLTPLLETAGFNDLNDEDVHSQSQWKIIRVHDEFCVFDVTSSASLTALKVPKLILEQDTDYSWQVKFFDNQATASEWSETGNFTTDFFEQDSDGNGVLDHQEVDTTTDLNQDGIMDRDQEDIKCVATETGNFKICLSIQEDEYAESILSIQSETPDDSDSLLSALDGPKFLAFGLIHFSLLVKEPGAEVLVTLYLSQAAYDDGIWYKYDPVNAEWFDYSEFIDFSADRKTAYLTLTDGGFGDADGIANGIIVDPLALRTATDHSSGSDFFVDSVAEDLDPTGTCFISSAGRQSPNLRGEIPRRELSIVVILIMFATIGKIISVKVKQGRRPGRGTSLMEGWRNSQGRVGG